MRRTLLLALVAPTLALSQPAKRPLTLDDYYLIEQVSSPAISPDGKWVAFVRSTIVEQENRRHSEIWLAATDGSQPPRRITQPGFSAADPRWSPDGTLLAFSSRRRAAPQAGSESAVWFLRFDGGPGEAFQIPGVIEMPLFSPDNQWIAFTRATPPGVAPNARPLSESERKIAERFTGKAVEWVSYRFDGRGYLPDPTDPRATPPREVYVIPRAGGTARRLTTLGVDASGLAWSPDSRRIAFVADSSQRDEYVYERADLYVVTLDGAIERLTNGEYDDDSPAWTPDGRALVFRRQLGLSAVMAARQPGAPVDVYRIPATGGTPENLTAQWDLLPGAPRLSADAVNIEFDAGVGGENHLFRLSLATGSVTQVTRGARRLTGLSLSQHGDRMAYVASDPVRPGEVFVADGNGGAERRLTNFNDAFVSSRLVQPVTRVSYPSKDATPIEGWLIMPPRRDTTQPVPLILAIHGGPHGAYGSDFNFQFQLWATNGFAVLYTNPRGSTGYGERFLWATWGGGWGIRDYEDVMAGVDHVIKTRRIDGKRLGVTGYSYGGFLTNWVITQTPRFSAAITGAGISNWISDYATSDIPRTKESEFYGAPWEPEGRKMLERQSPIYHAGKVVTPTMFIHGEADLRVPIEQAEQMYLALKKRKVDARFVRYPDTYHGGWTPWNTVHRYSEELKWWGRYLGPPLAQ